MAEEIVIPAVEEKKETPVPLDEAAARAYIKEKYGIEDDPETFRTKQAAWQDATEQIPRYQNALEIAQRLIMDRQTPVPAQGGAVEEEDEDVLRAQARLDPYTVIKRMRAQDDARIGRLIEERTRMAQAGAVGDMAYMTQQRDAGMRLRQEYPEAFDRATDLHKEGLRIYREEMSEMERKLPNAALIAAERAAGRIGLPPVSRRRPSEGDIASEVEGQTVSRRGAKTKDAPEDEKAKLTEFERHMAESMEIDSDVLARAKAARKAKKNLRG